MRKNVEYQLIYDITNNYYSYFNGNLWIFGIILFIIGIIPYYIIKHKYITKWLYFSISMIGLILFFGSIINNYFNIHKLITTINNGNVSKIEGIINFIKNDNDSLSLNYFIVNKTKFIISQYDKEYYTFYDVSNLNQGDYVKIIYLSEHYLNNHPELETIIPNEISNPILKLELKRLTKK